MVGKISIRRAPWRNTDADSRLIDVSHALERRIDRYEIAVFYADIGTRDGKSLKRGIQGIESEPDFKLSSLKRCQKRRNGRKAMKFKRELQPRRHAAGNVDCSAAEATGFRIQLSDSWVAVKNSNAKT